MTELFVREVAHGDDQVAGSRNIVDRPGSQPAQWQLVAFGGGDRAGVDPSGGVRARRRNGDRTGVAPQRGGQLGAGRVRSAHENHPVGATQRRRSQLVEVGGQEAQIGAPLVALRSGAGDQPFGFQDTQVVSEQVGRHAQHAGELGRGSVTDREGVDDAQPRRV